MKYKANYMFYLDKGHKSIIAGHSKNENTIFVWKTFSSLKIHKLWKNIHSCLDKKGSKYSEICLK